MTIETITVLVLAVIGSSGLWAFVQRVYERKHERTSTDHELLIALAHDRLYTLCTLYIQQGWIDADGLKNLTDLYDAYHDAGGNGTGTTLFERCTRLEVRQ